MKITALIVTFNPDLNSLATHINLLLEQVKEVVIVDNASENVEEITSLHKNQKIIFLKKNFGIGYAQNIGLEYCIESGADYVILFDQDSLSPANFISELLDATKENKATLAGPLYQDPRSKKISAFITEKKGIPFRWHLSQSTSQVRCIDVVCLIASGTLVNLQDIKSSGGLRSDYFIDYVDTEWCLRLRNQGYLVKGIPSIMMQHSLGDEVTEVWFFGKRQVSSHSPLRDYYMFRNTFLMIRDVPMSLIWKGHFIYRLFLFAGYFLVFCPLRKERLVKMFLGIVHGFKNIRGKLDVNTHKCQAIPKTALDPK